MPNRSSPTAGSRRCVTARAIALALRLLPMLCAADGVHAQACERRPPYQNLRFEEDWRFLSDASCATQSFDRWKYIATGNAPTQYLSLGLDARLRYERFENPGFGSEQDDRNGYWMQRILGHADWHVTPATRIFLQAQSSLIAGRSAGPRSTDKDTLDVAQAFADWTHAGDGTDFFTVRLGRQEIEFGSARLVTARDGLNDRQSFDGVRVVGQLRDVRYGGWLTRPSLTRPGAFDDGTDDSQTFSGAYLAISHTAMQGGNAALGFAGRRRDRVVYDQGAGHEDRQTYLLRSWARGESWDHNWEVGAQLGEFAGGDIRAWYLATDTGFRVTQWPLQPRLGLRVDAASGDDDLRNRELRTFNPLFPATAFSGLAGLIGPSNVYDVAPSATLRLTESSTLTLGAIAFWRQNRNDGIYAISGNLLRTGQRSGARHIGNQYTVQWNWNVSRHLTVLATLAWFDAGRFLQETPPGEDVTYFTSWLNFRF